jgi:hypothetical protein
MARPEFRFALMNWEWTANPQSSGWFVFITGGPDGVQWSVGPTRKSGTTRPAAK